MNNIPIDEPQGALSSRCPCLKPIERRGRLKAEAKNPELARATHQRAANDPTILRISIDDKAKVKIGPYSRGGKSPIEQDRNAADHDMGGGPTLGYT